MNTNSPRARSPLHPTEAKRVQRAAADPQTITPPRPSPEMPLIHRSTQSNRDMAEQLEQEVVDPVCGMTITPADSVGEVEHRGQTYYFCNESCLERFKADPEAFVGDAAVQLGSAA